MPGGWAGIRRTISRELRRNRSRNGYWAVAAQTKADARRSGGRGSASCDRPEVRRYVQRAAAAVLVARRDRRPFAERLSPRSAAAGFAPDDLRLDSTARGRRATLATLLAERRLEAAGRRENRGRIPACDQHRGASRPWSIAAAATATGKATRWSARAVAAGPSRWSSGNRATCCWAGPAICKPRRFGNAQRELFQPLPPRLRKTLTLDNGKEFAEHEQLAAEAALKVYFAEPYCAWQRGTNENTNGLIRQFFPKGTDLADIPEHRFTKVQQLLNNRPRKRLGYRTPLEILGSRLLAIDT